MNAHEVIPEILAPVERHVTVYRLHSGFLVRGLVKVRVEVGRWGMGADGGEGPLAPVTPLRAVPAGAEAATYPPGGAPIPPPFRWESRSWAVASLAHAVRMMKDVMGGEHDE